MTSRRLSLSLSLALAQQQQQQQRRSSRSRSRPRSARAVFSFPLSSTSFSLALLLVLSFLRFVPFSTSWLLVVVHLPFLPLVPRAGYSREIAATFSVLYTEGLGRRRGRYFHLESPARPPHTHMYTRAHGNTPAGGRERTRGRRGVGRSVGRTGGRGEGGRVAER